MNVGRQARKRKPVANDVASCVKHAIQENPFITMSTLSHMITKQCNLRLSLSTASRLTKKLGFSRKKAFRTIQRVHDPADVLAFCNQYDHATSKGCIISIDEAGFYVGDNPRYGYSPRGERLHVSSSRTLRRRKLTLVMAVTKDGVHHFSILDNNCNKASFISFISEMPCIPGATVLMDNLSFHHSADVRTLIEGRGMNILYSLPYSPRLNPIEYVFSSIKSTYRSHCPVKTQDSFDYTELLATSIYAQTDFLSCFTKVWQTTVAAVESDGLGFCGYDT
jgi:transposase